VRAAKEIQLQHRAAVTTVAVIDRAMQLLGSALGGQLAGVKDPDMSGGHHVVICSEQQIKVQTLLFVLSLHWLKCFDAVGWAAGRASGL